MTAGLERDVNIRAACGITGFLERGAFRVVFATADVRSFGDDLAVFDNDGADSRVGMRFAPVTPRQNKSAFQILCVITARCRPPR